MRQRELDRWIAAHPDLDERVANWRLGHPDGTLLDAVTGLELWPRNPHDYDVQWFVWRCLYEQGDPVATAGTFEAMRVPARSGPAKAVTPGMRGGARGVPRGGDCAWEQAAQTLLGWIISGKLQPGEQLPARTRLAGELDTSETTVTRALDELAALGFLDRTRRCYYVRAEPAAQAGRTP